MKYSISFESNQTLHDLAIDYAHMCYFHGHRGVPCPCNDHCPFGKNKNCVTVTIEEWEKIIEVK